MAEPLNTTNNDLSWNTTACIIHSYHKALFFLQGSSKFTDTARSAHQANSEHRRLVRHNMTKTHITRENSVKNGSECLPQITNYTKKKSYNRFNFPKPPSSPLICHVGAPVCYKRRNSPAENKLTVGDRPIWPSPWTVPHLVFGSTNVASIPCLWDNIKTEDQSFHQRCLTKRKTQFIFFRKQNTIHIKN